MSKTDKLIEKLRRGKLKTSEFKRILSHFGFSAAHAKGSHQTWTDGHGNVVVILLTREEPLPYQVKEWKEVILPIVNTEKAESNSEEE